MKGANCTYWSSRASDEVLKILELALKLVLLLTVGCTSSWWGKPSCSYCKYFSIWLLIFTECIGVFSTLHIFLNIFPSAFHSFLPKISRMTSLTWEPNIVPCDGYLVAVIGVNDGESGNKSSFSYRHSLFFVPFFGGLCFGKGISYSQNQFLVEPFHLNTSWKPDISSTYFRSWSSAEGTQLSSQHNMTLWMVLDT